MGRQSKVLSCRLSVLDLSTLTIRLTMTLLTRDPWIKVLLDAHSMKRMVRRWGRSLSCRRARLYVQMSFLN
jgi:hypothetical protein